MRLVVDTNIFISAALKEASSPAETVRWIARYGGLPKKRDYRARAFGGAAASTHRAEDRTGVL